MDDQNKNLLLATVLSVAVIVIWFIISPPEPPQSAEDPQTASESMSAPLAAGGVELATTPMTAAEEALAQAPRIAIETDRVEGSLSLLGGRIDELRLKDYRTVNTPDAPIVTLLNPEGKSGAYYSIHGWAPTAGMDFGEVPGPNTTWTAPVGAVLTVDSPVTLTWDNGQGLQFSKTIALDKDYMFTVTQSVTNTGDAAKAMAPYGVISRTGLPSDLKNFFILNEGVVRMSDGTLGETAYDDMPDFKRDDRERALAEVVQVEEQGWIGFTDHYWMTTLVPNGPFKSVAKYDPQRDVYQTEAVSRTMTVAPGETITSTSRLFAGAKEWAAIRGYQNEGGIEGFLDSIDWGWFYFLTKPIFAVLHWLNGMIGNMGWAIIALTLIIKFALLPLAYKSYVSMAKMKELQPEMEKLKESAGDDREKLQKGMMELYKKRKVNPAAGCLPILLQVPIFFSLYKVIFVTLELRHAPFFGVFQDLSAPDPTSIINLFGLLPFGAPEPGSIMALMFIGILPLLLGVSMWMQQKLNPAPTDPTQAMIFAWMPWVFMFMLGRFASGLVVYWITNNVITFTQQYLIMRSQGVKVDVFGNIMASFKRKPKDEG
ncbi:MAG: membrane protein insertase YidC [Planktomarina sp.]